MKSQAPSSSDVRAWAREAGLAVGDRGRLSPAVLDAYAKAHGGARVTTATKAQAKKATTAKKAPAKKAAAKKAPVKRQVVTHEPAPVVEPVAPAVAADSELLRSLQEQVHTLAGRVEKLEAARAAAAAEPRGLFRKKK